MLFLNHQGNSFVRTPEAASIARVTGYSKQRVCEFFKNLEEVFDKYNIAPHRIFNI